MIKKRYLTVLSVAIVSVLLGSLLYSSVTQAQRGREPTVYKDAIDINLYECSVGFQGGNLPFAFTPNRRFLNVTSFWIELVAISVGSGLVYPPLNVSMNEEVTYPLFVAEGNILSLCWRIDDAAFCEAILPWETNYIHLSSPYYEHLSIFKVRVSIEYEYQAR